MEILFFCKHFYSNNYVKEEGEDSSKQNKIKWTFVELIIVNDLIKNKIED